MSTSRGSRVRQLLGTWPASTYSNRLKTRASLVKRPLHEQAVQAVMAHERKRSGDAWVFGASIGERERRCALGQQRTRDDGPMALLFRRSLSGGHFESKGATSAQCDFEVHKKEKKHRTPGGVSVLGGKHIIIIIWRKK